MDTQTETHYLDRRNSDTHTVQILAIEELELLMSLISRRDLPDKTRDALRARLTDNLTLKTAATINDVNYRNVSRAEEKLLQMRTDIAAFYKVKLPKSKKKKSTKTK